MRAYTFNKNPPKETLAYFRAKGIKPGFDYRDVWKEQHATAFTVAKAMNIDVLESIRDELDRALAEGIPFAQFKKDLKPTLEKLGWWGTSQEVDPLTGKKSTVQLGSPRRLKTIYEVNMRTARAAGQWQRAQRTKRTHPYLLYQLGPSKEHRAEHQKWADTLLPIDHAWWQTHMPINGYGCKCRVRQVSKAEYARLSEKGQVSTQAPAVNHREWLNKRTGETVLVPEGIDPGFDTNPGAVAATDHAAKVFGTKLKTARAEVGALAMQNATDFIRAGMENNYRSWAEGLYNRTRQETGETQLVGSVHARLLHKLKNEGLTLDTAAITLQDKQVRHLARPNKKARQHALSEKTIVTLADKLAQPKAVLLDIITRSLIYLIEGEEKPGKVVVAIGHRDKAHLQKRRERIETNTIRTASEVNVEDITAELKGGRLKLLEGKL